METELHTPTIRDAKELTSLLTETFPSIEAVLLFGSVARGDANPWSDIDILVTSSDAKLTVAKLRTPISGSNHVSLVYYQTPSFETLYRRRPLFVAHLKKEGIVLYDPVGVLSRMLESLNPVKADIAEVSVAHDMSG
jgi:predicted nucleotidyltransferase